MANKPYKPKDSHPWRQYRNRPQDKEYEKAGKQNVRPLREFLLDFVENWDTYQVPAEGKMEVVKVKRMREDKVAAWLANFMKKHYAGSRDEYSIV